MNKLEEKDRIILQEWIDKLAEITNPTVDILKLWSTQIPLKNIDNIDPTPLFLYGDATIDKAIIDIIQNKEVNFANLNDEIKKNFCIDNSIVDISLSSLNAVNPIQELDQWYDLPKIENQDKLLEYIKKNDNLNCELKDDNGIIRLKSLDAIPVHNKILKALSNFSRNYEKKINHKNFAKVDNKSFDIEFLRDNGFELIDYSQIQWLFCNDDLTYIITKNTPGNTVEVEYCNGDMRYYNSIEEFIHSIEDDIKQLGNVKKNFSRKNFAESNKKQVGICWFNKDLTDILDHYEIDFENTNSEFHNQGREYIYLDKIHENDFTKDGNLRSCILHSEYLDIIGSPYEKYDYPRARICYNLENNKFYCYLPTSFVNNKNASKVLEEFLKLNNFDEKDIISGLLILDTNKDY